jgi:hypothetical protein
MAKQAGAVSTGASNVYISAGSNFGLTSFLVPFSTKFIEICFWLSSVVRLFLFFVPQIRNAHAL